MVTQSSARAKERQSDARNAFSLGLGPMSNSRTPPAQAIPLVLPAVSDIAAMTVAERVALTARLDAYAEAIATARGALQAFLYEPPPSAPLIEAKEAARRLGTSVDFVRDHGDALEIAVPLDGIVRYAPEAIEGLRRRRLRRLNGAVQGPTQ